MTESVRSKQCLQIETVDDSLAEYTETFTVSIFTNNSAVNEELHTIYVYITSNDGIVMTAV